MGCRWPRLDTRRSADGTFVARGLAVVAAAAVAVEAVVVVDVVKVAVAAASSFH